MKYPVLIGLLVCVSASLVSAWTAHSQTAAEARKFLASPAHQLYNSPTASYDDIFVNKVKTLIAQRQYKAALNVLDELDNIDGFDTGRINYLPDLAIVALAADNSAQYTYFRSVAHDAARAAKAQSVCKQDPYYHLQSDQPATFEHADDITNRLCNSLTANKPVILAAEYQTKMTFLGMESTPMLIAATPAALMPKPEAAPLSALTSLPMAEIPTSLPASATPAAPIPYVAMATPSIMVEVPAEAQPETTVPAAKPMRQPKRVTPWVTPARDGSAADTPYRPRRKAR